MKPHRIRMTHNLLLNYGLYRKMEIYVREGNLSPLTLVVQARYWESVHVKMKCWCMCFSRQRPHKANAEEMTKYHSDDYIKFLRSIRPDNMSEYSKQMQRCEYISPPHACFMHPSPCSHVLRVFKKKTLEDCQTF